MYIYVCVYIYIYIYIYIYVSAENISFTSHSLYILLLCLFRVLLVDIFKRFRVQHFFRVQIRVQIVIFITFHVHQVQIQKLTLNRNKNKKGGFRGAQRVEKGVTG